MRTKAYAFDSAGGFGMYAQYISTGVSCRNLTSGDKRSSRAKRTVAIKKGRRFPLSPRLSCAVANHDIGALNLHSASDDAVLMPDLRSLSVGNFNSATYKRRKWRNGVGNIIIWTGRSTVLIAKSFPSEVYMARRADRLVELLSISYSISTVVPRNITVVDF